MRKWVRSFLVLALGLIFIALPVSHHASAQQSIPETLVLGCSKEIVKFCKPVTLGQGRVVACLYSYSDKLSADCAFAMYDASEQYENIMSALRYLAKKTSCRSDITSYCKGIPPGGGRIYDCIKKNKATLTNGCRAALPKAEELLRRAGIR